MNNKPSFFTRFTAFLIRRPYGIVAGCSVFTAITLALVIGMLMQERRDAALRAVGNAENLALVVERDVARLFELIDLSLQAVVEGVETAGVKELPPAIRRQILFDRAVTAGQYMGVLLYVDERGDIAIDSTSLKPRAGNFADRAWFVTHRDNPQAGLFISTPYQSRLREQDWSIAFSRRVNHADGSFAGVAVGALRIDYFRHLLAGLDLGRHGAIALVHDDGTLVMRNPETPAQIGRNLNGTANFDRFQRTRARWFFGSAAIDAEKRLYVYRKFEKIPLLITVAPAAQDIYAAWTRRAWLIGSFATLLAGALLGAAWLLAAEFRYRRKIEADLLMLSRTDGLTGLNNRRTLDDALQNEWRRAKRAGKPLSVLFIDIDRFKNFNDRYGHQAGDDTLAAGAAAIASGIRRPGDIAARFGGEEFVVVLPDTEISGAVAVAAKIHRAVRALHIVHEASEYAVVSVSIGAACSGAGDTAGVPALLKAADQTLYAAKAGGRNQTALAPAGGIESMAGTAAGSLPEHS